MRLYVVRHAEAYAVGEHGIRTDAARPLTPRGQFQARCVGLALTAVNELPERILSSTHVRAWQTAETIAGALDEAELVTACDALTPPGDFDALIAEVRAGQDNAVAIVGHEPFLGYAVARLIGSSPEDQDVSFSLAKATVARLDLPAHSSPWNEASLKWLLSKRVLRCLSNRTE